MAMDQSFTLRAVLAGLVISVFINLSNTYYGLQIGVASQMSMISGLLGYAGFKLFSRFLTTPFTIAEHVLVVSVATASGCMPITAGFIGVIPALEYLLGPDDNGPFRFSWGALMVWSIGLCFFGLIFASLFRNFFIVREKLPWPGARATAHLLNTLHHADGKPQRQALSVEFPTDGTSPDDNSSDTQSKDNVATLVRAAVVSGALAIAMHYVPILHRFPIFGRLAASKWLWSIDLSPGFFGQGIISGPVIPLHMLAGSIVGWGILSPYAKHRGWAPGEVDDWERGSRGWIIWVSLAVLLSDGFVNLLWTPLRPVWKRRLIIFEYIKKHSGAIWESITGTRAAVGYTTLPHDEPDDNLLTTQDHHDQFFASGDSLLQPKREEAARDSTYSSILGLSFVLSVIVCTIAVHFLFSELIPWYYTILAVLLLLPMAVVGIRSLAETDYNPGSTLVSQLAFAALISASNPNAIVVNLLSAALAQAGESQAGGISYDFKVGHIVGAPLEVQIPGQIIGSLFGALISCGIYKLYAAKYPIPGPLFRIPAAFVILSTARLLMGRGLPKGVAPFALTAGIISAAITVVRIRYSNRWWQPLIPSGVAFAVGIYNAPSFTITRAIGERMRSRITETGQRLYRCS
ncbi:OPT oligopeptide transporter protein-domain-containing protein [Triangularia verruculosa]|uniref:OPT oligopeptide transporter protein-domain-containing protein n=1 Tax=Triangularia verruculosa TaxID=2587418 RepID=A0AAN6XAG4_9PEZI|nr:OPT oligopeptide transporter protein-domain-containing protein [Triangularia verruculosa]